jgi:transcriptional regulator GlxA family with amidase domain
MSHATNHAFPLTAGILIFDDVEVLDFCGPFEVFGTARPLGAPSGPAGDDRRIFTVLTLAAPRMDDAGETHDVAGTEMPPIGVHAHTMPDPRAVRCRNGLRVVADLAIGRDEVPPLDVLVVPGGWGTRREVRNPALIAALRELAPATRAVTASVCTGAFLLAEAGLLDDRRATTHWASLERLRDGYPRVRVEGLTPGEPVRPYGVRYVDEGRVVTSAGIAAGIDMALHLVARLAGDAVARQTAERMEYRWEPDRREAHNAGAEDTERR